MSIEKKETSPDPITEILGVHIPTGEDFDADQKSVVNVMGSIRSAVPALLKNPVFTDVNAQIELNAEFRKLNEINYEGDLGRKTVVLNGEKLKEISQNIASIISKYSSDDEEAHVDFALSHTEKSEKFRISAVGDIEQARKFRDYVNTLDEEMQDRIRSNFREQGSTAFSGDYPLTESDVELVRKLVRLWPDIPEVPAVARSEKRERKIIRPNVSGGVTTPPEGAVDQQPIARQRQSPDLQAEGDDPVLPVEPKFAIEQKHIDLIQTVFEGVVSEMYHLGRKKQNVKDHVINMFSAITAGRVENSNSIPKDLFKTLDNLYGLKTEEVNLIERKKEAGEAEKQNIEPEIVKINEQIINVETVFFEKLQAELFALYNDPRCPEVKALVPDFALTEIKGADPDDGAGDDPQALLDRLLSDAPETETDLSDPETAELMNKNETMIAGKESEFESKVMQIEQRAQSLLAEAQELEEKFAPQTLAGRLFRSVAGKFIGGPSKYLKTQNKWLNATGSIRTGMEKKIAKLRDVNAKGDTDPKYIKKQLRKLEKTLKGDEARVNSIGFIFAIYRDTLTFSEKLDNQKAKAIESFIQNITEPSSYYERARKNAGRTAMRLLLASSVATNAVWAVSKPSDQVEGDGSPANIETVIDRIQAGEDMLDMYLGNKMRTKRGIEVGVIEGGELTLTDVESFVRGLERDGVKVPEKDLELIIEYLRSLPVYQSEASE